MPTDDLLLHAQKNLCWMSGICDLLRRINDLDPEDRGLATLRPQLKGPEGGVRAIVAGIAMTMEA